MTGLHRLLPTVALVLTQCILPTIAVPLTAGEDTQTFLTDTSASSPYHPEQDADTIHTENAEAQRAPSWFTSTLMARRLLALSTTGVASTIFPQDPPENARTPPEVAGQSISLKEYISDCDAALPADISEGGNGDPTFLALHVATTFRNTAAGSNISLSLDWWDHLNDTEPLFPGFPLSPAGLPRVTLFGHIEEFPAPLSRETESALQACYLDAHPDARVWLPGRPHSPHASFWARMVVTQVYWIGGFGGFQQIGWMNVSEWKGVRREASLPGIGDGRGWADVRLPGEKD
ncbi:pyridoxamine 5'-phosphate oxidase-domain-containing protein [Aspergillus avenaceus]|uniref:Pyridoxamine 5'-phosphate oxidase-domain-containing protein n=1 Tax=Aspergillus avenaceus TaxID=36643 RepID=A0A5N6TDH5_ASPAV|nr:pyridoxamine 5'-phosphate oxidase-domain-containing protein [Aspergillus avenaceus]